MAAAGVGFVGDQLSEPVSCALTSMSYIMSSISGIVKLKLTDCAGRPGVVEPTPLQSPAGHSFHPSELGLYLYCMLSILLNASAAVPLYVGVLTAVSGSGLYTFNVTVGGVVSIVKDIW